MTTPRSEPPTFAERIAARLEARERGEHPHVCGNCRNPWTKYGREDCPNNNRRTR